MPWCFYVCCWEICFFLPCKMQTFVKQIKAQTVSLVYMTHTNSLVSLWTPVQVYKCPWPWLFPSLGQQWLGMSSYPCCLLTLWFPVKVLCSSPCRGWGTTIFSELTIQPPANIVSSYRKFKKKNHIQSQMFIVKLQNSSISKFVYFFLANKKFYNSSIYMKMLQKWRWLVDLSVRLELRAEHCSALHTCIVQMGNHRCNWKQMSDRKHVAFCLL